MMTLRGRRLITNQIYSAPYTALPIVRTMKALILLPVIYAYWSCPQDQTLTNDNYSSTFPNGDLYYQPNTTCTFKIAVAAGQIALLNIQISPSPDDIINCRNNYLSMNLTMNVPNVAVVGPAPFVFTIISSPNSNGTFQVNWYYQNVQFLNPEIKTIVAGNQPIIVRTFDLFSSAKILNPSAGESVAISTVSFGRLGADYVLSGLLVYAGNNPGNTDLPIACLYNNIGKSVPQIFNITVTLINVAQPFDAGMIAISAGSDVKKFTQLKYVYFDLSESYNLDATQGPAALTLYQQDMSVDVLNGWTLFDATTFSLYAGGVPLTSYNLLSNYEVSPIADNSVPQWIPGTLKTFYLEQGSLRIWTTPNNTDPLNAISNQTGFYKSNFYPFTPDPKDLESNSGSSQDNTLYFQSSYPLYLIVKMINIDSYTTIEVNTTGIYGSQICRFPDYGTICQIYGTNFRFTSRSSQNSSTGGIIHYSFQETNISIAPPQDITTPKTSCIMDTILVFLFMISIFY